MELNVLAMTTVVRTVRFIVKTGIFIVRHLTLWRLRRSNLKTNEFDLKQLHSN